MRRAKRRMERDAVRLFRPTWTRNGVLRESLLWWIQYRENGRRIRGSLGTTERVDAELLAAKVRERLRLKAAGLLDPHDDLRGLPLHKHVLAFRTLLRSRGVTAGHLKDRMACLVEVLRATGVRRLVDLNADAVGARLTELRRQGAATRTANRRFAAVRAFSRFAVESLRLARDPLVTLRAANESGDKRRVRRAPTVEELARLLDAADRRPVVQAEGRGYHLKDPERERLVRLGRSRRTAYLLLVSTGLRRNEGATLEWKNLNLDAATVTVEARYAKNRKEATLPLPRPVVDALLAWRGAGAAPTARVFPDGLPGMRTFRRDLDFAKVPYRTDAGVLDVHSLRVGFATALARAGVPLALAQRLMRHSDPRLTSATYTRWDAGTERGAVEDASGAWACLSPACPDGAQTAHSGAPSRTEGVPATAPEVETENVRIRAVASGNREVSASRGNGGGGGIRTLDPRLAKPVLYP